MVSIFAREISDGLTSLVKQIDATVAKNSDKKMAAFVVLLSEDPDGDEAKLKKLAKEQKIEKTPLTIYEGVSGPGNYKVSKDADVTVIMWVGKKVKVNHAFRKGGLDKDAVAKVVADTAGVLD